MKEYTINSTKKYAAKIVVFALCWFASMAWVGCSGDASNQSLPPRMVRGGWIAKNDVGAILSDTAKRSLRQVWDLGTRWVALGPEVMMEDIYRPPLKYGHEDKSFREFIRWVRQKGFQVMLMPRIESPAFFLPPFPFRADIQMLSSDHVDLFFQNYEKMLVHYGKLCEEEGVQIFSIGLEYLSLVKEHPQRWRTMIRAVRQVYNGKLTYSANWYEEYEAVTFWDDLDFIGVGAYFELDVSQNANIPEMKEAWKPIVKQLKVVHERYKKPVLFTEVGYTGFVDAAQFPWKWQTDTMRAISPEHQANCYTAMFETFSKEPWFYGLFVWRFYTMPSNTPNYDYNPVGKPTEDVLQQWFQSKMTQTSTVPME